MNRQGPLKPPAAALAAPTIAVMDFGERPWRPVVVDVSLDADEPAAGALG